MTSTMNPEEIIDLEPFDRYCDDVRKKYNISEPHLSCYMTWYGDPMHTCEGCSNLEICERMYKEGVDCDE